MPNRNTVASVEPSPVRLAGYEVLGELGRGGMGLVYKARQVSLNRLAALKLLPAGAPAGSEERARFRREAEAVARLQHPNIVQIHEIGERDGCLYLALEYVDGGSLAQHLQGTPLLANHATQLVSVVAKAVHYAHQRGIVHRDLKPANVLLQKGQQGQQGPEDFGPFPVPDVPFGLLPKIADFGLAKLLDAEAGQTQTGNILGTPSYMAPEQAEGKSRVIGPVTDVYALGALLYELLTGRPPFRAATLLETLEQVRSQEPVPPRLLQPALPRPGSRLHEMLAERARAALPLGC